MTDRVNHPHLPQAEDYADAAERCFVDAETLFQGKRYPNACHLFGLGAECALKVLLEGHPGLAKVPTGQTGHLPELRDEVLRTLQGKRYNGVRKLMSLGNYMNGWEIANRYWPTQRFSEEMSSRYRDHCRRTLYAAEVRVGV